MLVKMKLRTKFVRQTYNENNLMIKMIRNDMMKKDMVMKFMMMQKRTIKMTMAGLSLTMTRSGSMLSSCRT